MTVIIEELVVPEGTLLAVRVPQRPGDTPVGTSQGLYKVRVGKNCMPLDPTEWDRRQAAAGTLDWSALPMAGAGMDDIDPLEVARVRRTIETNRPRSDLHRLADGDLLSSLGAVRDGNLTRAGFLLMGKAERLARLLPQHELIYIHFTSETEFDHRLDLKEPLLSILERVAESIASRNPFRVLTSGLFRTNIPAFPEGAYREAILNALIHRNYLELGSVYVRHYEDRMEIANPGGLVEGITPQNFLHAEPRARNRLLAEIVQRMGLVERAGVGRRRVFLPILQFGKRPPRIESDDRSFRITLHDGSFDEPLAAFIAARMRSGTDFDVVDLLLLSHLRRHGEIDTGTAAELMQLPPSVARDKLDQLVSMDSPWLERRGKKRGVSYHLNREAATALLGRAAYTKERGIDRVRWPEMVRAYVEREGSISNAEVRSLFGLGNSEAASVEASRFLRDLSRPGGLLEGRGRGKNRRYVLRRAPDDS